MQQRVSAEKFPSPSDGNINSQSALLVLLQFSSCLCTSKLKMLPVMMFVLIDCLLQALVF